MTNSISTTTSNTYTGNLNVTTVGGLYTGTTTGGCPLHPMGLCTCNSTIGVTYNWTQSQYANAHQCVGPLYSGNTTVLWDSFFCFKEAKEIMTDKEIIFKWDGTLDAHLPALFSDCFLKVGHQWSPLYPLIFSAFMLDAKEMSFHIVTSITDKIFEEDKVVLKNVTVVRIEDNLNLIQLADRTKNFFKDK